MTWRVYRMFRKWFRSGSDRRAEEAATRRVCEEIRREREADLQSVYDHNAQTQEILGRIDARRGARQDQPDPTIHG